MIRGPAKLFITMNCVSISITPANDYDNLTKATFKIDAVAEAKRRKESLNNNFNINLRGEDMGLSDLVIRCKTCDNSDKFKCFGHPGVFINMPMYCSVVFAKTLAKIASFVCHKCHTLKETIKKAQLRTALAKATSIGQILAAFDDFKVTTGNGNCSKCVAPLLKYKVFHGLTIGTTDAKRGSIMTNLELQEFKQFLLGSHDLAEMFSSPQLYRDFVNGMFMTTISILPPSMRKGTYSVISQSEQVSYITMEYPYIFTKAIEIIIGAGENRQEVYVEYLKKIMNIMFGKDIPANFPIGTKPAPLINLGGKYGELRERLTSKVTESSGKESLCCDDRLKFNEMGITQDHAKTATRREIVTHYNIKRLQEMKDQSAIDHYPSINKVVKKDTEITIHMQTFADYELEVGDEIYRDLIDGDDIIVLRQPAMMSSNNFYCIVRVYPSDDNKKTGIHFHSRTVAGFLRGDCDGDIVMLIYNTNAKGDLFVLMPAEQNFKQFKNGGFDIFITNDPMVGLFNATQAPFPVNTADLISQLVLLDVPCERIEAIVERFEKTSKTSADMVCAGFPETFSHKYKDGLNETSKWGYGGFVVEDGRYMQGVITPDVFSGSDTVSIQRGLTTNYGTSKGLKIVHDITMLGQVACNMTGVTIDYGRYGVTEKYTKASIEYQAGAIEAANTYLEISRICPMATDDKKYKQGVTGAQSIVSAGPLIGAMVPHIIDGIRNPVYKALLCKKGNSKVMGVGLGIGDFANLQLNLRKKRYSERANHMSHYYPLDIKELGYNKRTFFNALTIADYLVNLSLARIAALGRKDGTKIPGTAARQLKWNCGSNQTGIRGVFFGTLANKPTLTMLYIPNCGGMPNKCTTILSSSWIEATPKSMKVSFEAAPELWRLYKDIYDNAVTRFNNYKHKLWGPCDCIDTEPIFIDFALYQWTVRPAPKGDKGIRQILALETFVKLLPFMTFGTKAYKDGFNVPDYCHQMVSIQILNFLSCMTPRAAIGIDPDDLIDELGRVYDKMVGMLPPPNLAIGITAVCALMEEATQMALDAPKNNMIADEAVYSILRCMGTTYNPGDWTVFIVKVEKPHINWLEYIECTLEDLTPAIKVYTNGFDSGDYPLFEFTSKTQLDNPVVCKFIIQQQKLLNKGINVPRFIASLVRSGVVFYIEELTSIYITVVIAFDAKDETEINNKMIIGFANSVVLSKCIGIKDIQMSATNINVVDEEGDLSKKPVTHLYVTARRLEVLYQIPGIDVNSVMCENPCAQSHFFGTPSSRLTMSHALREKFKGHPASNIAHLVSIAHINDTCVVLNNHFMNRIGTKKLLPNISAQGESSKIIGAVKIGECDASETISSMITGLAPCSGSNSVIKIR